jgi:hypothetical protein
MVENFYDPFRERLVRFPEHWPQAARSYFLDQWGSYLAEQAQLRVIAEREQEA